jgi:hypothetical protein
MGQGFSDIPQECLELRFAKVAQLDEVPIKFQNKNISGSTLNEGVLIPLLTPVKFCWTIPLNTLKFFAFD